MVYSHRGQPETPIEAVVFDLDDTLYAERDYVRSGYRAVAEVLRRRIHCTERFEDWMWMQFLAGHSRQMFNRLNERYHLKLTETDLERLMEVYRTHQPTIEPYGGMADFLGRLSGSYRLGLLADGFLPAQALKLHALRLERYFDAVVFTEQLGREFWKPSPRGFELIAQRLDVSHAACAYVSDNPTKDFAAPNQLGWRSIQLLRPGQLHSGNPACENGRPRFVVRELGQVYVALR